MIGPAIANHAANLNPDDFQTLSYTGSCDAPFSYPCTDEGIQYTFTGEERMNTSPAQATTGTCLTPHDMRCHDSHDSLWGTCTLWNLQMRLGFDYQCWHEIAV